MMNAETEFTEAQRRKIKAAYDYWQSEESRDRGYDFQLCQRLRQAYYAEIWAARDENKTLEDDGFVTEHPDIGGNGNA